MEGMFGEIFDEVEKTAKSPEKDTKEKSKEKKSFGDQLSELKNEITEGYSLKSLEKKADIYYQKGEAKFMEFVAKVKSLPKFVKDKIHGLDAMIESRLKGIVAEKLLKESLSKLKNDFTEQDKLKAYAKLPRQERRSAMLNTAPNTSASDNLMDNLATGVDNLGRRGIANFIDSDTEYYIGSMHTIEAMRIIIRVAYPNALSNGEKIDNPIKWAMDMLKGQGSAKAPRNYIIKESLEYFDPYENKMVKSTPGQGVESLFEDRQTEIKLFEKYDSGKKRIGKDSYLDAVPDNLPGAEYIKPDQGSFLSRDGGVVKGSDPFFSIRVDKMVKILAKDAYKRKIGGVLTK